VEDEMGGENINAYKILVAKAEGKEPLGKSAKGGLRV
jgi:hypothetical protein